jgi:tetratricopeptide (TPR) repeat protein
MSATAVAVTTRVARVSGQLVPGLCAAGAAVLVGSLAAAHGGYFPTTWGWATLAAAWAAVMALLLRRRIAFSGAELLLLGGAGAFVAWIGLSILWSSVPVESVDELERGLVYLTSLVALVLLVRRRSVPVLLGATTTAVTLVSAYALATRLFPDRVGQFDSIAAYRLSEPVGYWNALGILAVLGALLALGLAARAERIASRAAAAAALPILLLTIEFTFSRGSWMALAAGLAAAVAVDPRRLQLLLYALVLAPGCALAVWLATHSTALTTIDSPLPRAAHEGHTLALALAGLSIASAVLATLMAVLERRVEPGRGVRRVFALSLVAVALAGGLGALAAAGGPTAAVHKAAHSFESAQIRPQKLSKRLLSLSSNGRSDLWRTAWLQFESRPLVGGGAGSFEQYWRANRPNTLDVRDAHSLYLETLAELGLVGLVLLVAFLAAPLLAVRHRHAPFVAVALAAYVAFLVHAGLDWDWEMPAVTLAGLTCGVAALAATRGETPRTDIAQPIRWIAIALLAVVAAFAAIALVGNRALDGSASAASGHDWRRAASEARSARTWLPWSSEPWRLLGEARFGRGDFPGAAVAYRKAIELDPRDWLLWFDLGWATSGRTSDAAFAHARALDPLNPDIPRRTAHAR